MIKRIVTILIISILGAACTRSMQQDLGNLKIPILQNQPTAVEETQPLATAIVNLKGQKGSILTTPSSVEFPLIGSSGSITNTYFLIQPGTPTYLPNFVQSQLGCNWTGVSGQAFGSDGKPVNGLVVEIGGNLEGQDVLLLALTGSSPMLGPGGFDITLADHLVASDGTLHIQLFDLAGVPLSAVTQFATVSSCEKNQVLINFSEAAINHRYYFPFFILNYAK